MTDPQRRACLRLLARAALAPASLLGGLATASAAAAPAVRTTPALAGRPLVSDGPAQAAAAGIHWLHGDWRQGSVIIGRAPAGLRLNYAGRELLLDDEHRFVLGLDRDAAPLVELRLQAASGAARVLHFAVGAYDWQIQRIDGLPEDKVNPPAAATARIEREAALIRAARSADSALEGFAEPWLWPVHGEVSGLFGRQRILNGTPKQPHMGLDIAVPTGTEVLSPAQGVVRLAERDLYFTGGTMIVDHGHGLFSIFAHLSALQAQVGQHVARGAVLAHSGATGRATGPHLHWGTYWFDAHVDPLRMVGASA